METQEQEIPARRKSILPYLIGVGIVALLAVTMFVAGKYMSRNEGIGNLMDEEEHAGDLIMSEELPKTEPQTMGVFLERKDNSVFVGPASSIRIMVPSPGEEGEPVMDADFVGDKVEVVISNDTIIYRDVTPFDPENADKAVQQILELSTIDAISPQSAITVWGRKAGDRVLADVIMFLSPFAFQKGAP